MGIFVLTYVILSKILLDITGSLNLDKIISHCVFMQLIAKKSCKYSEWKQHSEKHKTCTSG